MKIDQKVALTITVAIGLLLLAVIIGYQERVNQRKAGEPTVDFVTQVKPLLAGKCLPCHHSGVLSGNLSFETKRTAFGGSKRGAFIVAGEPENSLIYTLTGAMHGARDATPAMPAVKGVSLNEEERELLRVWIKEGAIWPEGEEGYLKPLDISPNEA